MSVFDKINKLLKDTTSKVKDTFKSSKDSVVKWITPPEQPKIKETPDIERKPFMKLVNRTSEQFNKFRKRFVNWIEPVTKVKETKLEESTIKKIPKKAKESTKVKQVQRKQPKIQPTPEHIPEPPRIVPPEPTGKWLQLRGRLEEISDVLVFKGRLYYDVSMQKNDILSAYDRTTSEFSEIDHGMAYLDKHIEDNEDILYFCLDVIYFESEDEKKVDKAFRDIYDIINLTYDPDINDLKSAEELGIFNSSYSQW